MAINVTTSKQQITASVAEDKISATVSGGFGATGPSGVINVTAPITNAGTTTAANVGLAVGDGLSVSSGSLRVTPGTYATLVGGKVPADQLPSYVDDVLEYANLASLPGTGESGKIYVALNTGKIYRWSGSAYFEISTQPGNTDAVPEGSTNLYFTNARARNSFGTGASGQVVAWSGSEWTAGTVVIASVTGLQTALDGKAASSHNHDASAINAGTLSADRLPLAAANTRGAVRIGSGISIDGNGVISASSAYTLPTATASVLGGVKIGAGVTITDGAISVSTDYAATSHTHDTLTSGTDELSLDGAGAITFTHSPGGGSLKFPQSAGGIARIVAPSTQGLGIYSGNNAEPVYIYTVNDKSIGGLHLGDIRFAADNSLQTTAWLGSVDWTSVNNKPSTFEPTSHKTSHATGGSDALTASDIGAAAASHAHGNITNAGAIGSTSGQIVVTTTSGVLTTAATIASSAVSGLGGAATLNVGTTAGTVAAGDHTHTQLHDRSHAITSSSDHTATAWRAFYSNGSGVITELALGASGTVLTSGGASAAPTFSALPTGGTKTIIRFHPGDNQPPAANFATLDTRNSFLVLEFDAAIQESANFIGVIPEGATLTNGLTVRLWWMGDTATSGNVRWGVSFERVGTDNDADSFSSVTEATGAANGTSGIETVTSITATAIDSLVAGDRFRLRVTRIADDATNDTMTGDAQLVAVEVQVA